MDISADGLDDAEPTRREVAEIIRTWTPERSLIVAIQHGGGEYVQYAREHLMNGADPNAVIEKCHGRSGEKCYTTPMHEAAKQPDAPEYMTDLIWCGGDANRKVPCRAGRRKVVLMLSPIDLARIHKHPRLKELLPHKGYEKQRKRCLEMEMDY